MLPRDSEKMFPPLGLGGAEDLFKRSIELQPTLRTAYQWYATLLFGDNRPRKGKQMMRRAPEIDPSSSEPPD